MQAQLSKLNGFPILSVEHPDFARYGRAVEGYDLSPLLEYMEQRTQIPSEGNVYVASDLEMEKLSVIGELARGFFGGLPMQGGYCNGNNSKLNCLEYHKSSELDVAVTHMVLLLAHLDDMQENEIESSRVKAFYLPAGSAVELYGTTLHFSPCKVQDSGFKSVILLPKGTNQPLDYLRADHNPEDTLLWMCNKWLVTLPGTVQAQKGAFVGISGKNIEILY